MTLKQMRAFLAVAQTLSFANACEMLHISQSALSLSIKALEDSLGGKLFKRSTRSVRLTPEGEALLPEARRLLADWDNVRDDMRQRFTLQRGLVTIAAIPSFAGNLLPTILSDFRARHPHISIKIQDVINERVIEMLQVRQVELGIAFEPPQTAGLNFTPLYVDRFVAVVSAGSTLAGATQLSWDELLTEPFIALQRPSAVRYLLEQHLHQKQLSLPVEFESHQLTTVGRMVSAGLGVSAMPALCIAQMKELGACCIPLTDPVIEKPIGILTNANDELSVAAQALFDTLAAFQGKFADGQLARGQVI